jgi:CSLREA domain-containing protein
MKPIKARNSIAILQHLCFMMAGICVFSIIFSAKALPATINVNVFSDTDSNDGKCSFREAIKAINNGSAYRGCSAPGTGSNTIQLQSGVYDFFASFTINKPVEIKGMGQSNTTLRGNTTGPALIINSPGPSDDKKISMLGLTITNIGGGRALRVSPNCNFNMLLCVVTDSGGPNTTDGGGIYNEGSTSLYFSTVKNNSVAGNGGGLWNSNFFQAYNTTFSFNSGNNGGGIYNRAYARLENSTIYGNFSANNGGGAYVEQDIDGSYFELVHATVTNNLASEQGGGVYLIGNDADTKCKSSIIANNNSFTFGPDHIGFIDNQQYRCFVGNSQGTVGMFELMDPAFNWNIGLFHNGGPTETVDFFSWSPAINAHTFPDEEAEDQFTLDQRGFKRPNGGVIDVGAIEYRKTFFYETEFLTVASKSSDSHIIEFDPTRTSGERPISGLRVSGGQFTKLQSNATNDFVTYSLYVHEAGLYTVRAKVKTGRDRGKFQLETADSASGPWTKCGEPVDLFATQSSHPEKFVGIVSLNSSGEKFFRFKVTGKHTSSSNYNLVLDYISLSR